MQRLRKFYVISVIVAVMMLGLVVSIGQVGAASLSQDEDAVVEPFTLMDTESYTPTDPLIYAVNTRKCVL